MCATQKGNKRKDLDKDSTSLTTIQTTDQSKADSALDAVISRSSPSAGEGVFYQGPCPIFRTLRGHNYYQVCMTSLNQGERIR